MVRQRAFRFVSGGVCRVCSRFAARRKQVRQNHVMSITVRILGPVTIEAAGGRLALSPKLRAVLALLAAHR